MEVAIGTGQLEPAFVEDWLDRFLEGWNAHQPEALLPLCTQDVTWSDPAAPELLRGHEQLRGFMRSTFEAFPDLEVSERGHPYLATDEPRVLAGYRMTGTMRGDWDALGLAATGARLRLEGLDEYVFDGELLCACRTFYDSLGTARQLGILPSAGGHGDRALARLQRLKARFQRRAAARR